MLLAGGEADVRPAHHLISHVPVPPLEPFHARSFDLDVAGDVLIDDLARLTAVRAGDEAEAHRGPESRG